MRCIVHAGILPSDEEDNVCCWQRRTSSSCRSKRPALQLSCFSHPPLLFFLPECCHRCNFFCLLSFALGSLVNVVSLFVVVTSACQIAGVIPLSSFSFTLSNSASVIVTSSRCPVLASHHLPCITKNIAGTLCMGTLCSLHVFFRYVQSIFLVITFQCPLYGVNCALVPYQGNLGKSDCNGSHWKGFMMCIDLWVWTCLSNLVCFSILKPNMFCYIKVQ